MPRFGVYESALYQLDLAKRHIDNDANEEAVSKLRSSYKEIERTSIPSETEARKHIESAVNDVRKNQAERAIIRIDDLLRIVERKQRVEIRSTP